MSFIGKYDDAVLLRRSLMKSVQLNQVQPFQRLTCCIYDNDERLGITSLIRSETTNNQCEIGIIINRLFINQGIANEVMAHLIDFAFTKLEIVGVYANFSINNIAMHKLLENLGFKVAAARNGFHYGYIENQLMN